MPAQTPSSHQAALARRPVYFPRMLALSELYDWWVLEVAKVTVRRHDN
ncbi:hypothetical protein [Candidatus Nitronereus thalassa]|uniref:Uncharacterized protein n=1 Tax=Candidatus Nitronereus thalassa TaxID=3020898 RepID=A0ABU3KA15_9BACT|nr:hypothetical protein [Candidatus Nitronereus thalassa]MDT7043202.1 hypothetical protein [Candidatus Nitronereus thalassa]